MKNIKMILAVAEGTGAIGNKGKLPWYCPRDLEYFRSQVTGKDVVCSRGVWEGMPNSLKDTFASATILSESKAPLGAVNLGEGRWYLAPGEFYGLIAGMEESEDFGETLWVLGGVEVYETMAPYCSEIHMSVIHRDVKFDRAVDCEKILKGRTLRKAKSLSHKTHVGVWV